MRKTYRQLKDSLTCKKGAIWQEKCDDGTQDFILLTPEYNKFPATVEGIIERCVIQDQSDWFEPIVEIAYLTEGEMVVKKPSKGKTSKESKRVMKGWTPERRAYMSKKMSEIRSQKHWTPKRFNH